METLYCDVLSTFYILGLGAGVHFTVRNQWVRLCFQREQGRVAKEIDDTLFEQGRRGR